MALLLFKQIMSLFLILLLGFITINMIAIFVGLAMMLCRIRLPHLVITTMDSVSALLGPLAMLTIGMLLGGMDLKSVFTSKRIYVITLLRLVVFPLILLVLLKFFPLETLVKDGKTILYVNLSSQMRTHYGRSFQSF